MPEFFQPSNQLTVKFQHQETDLHEMRPHPTYHQPEASTLLLLLLTLHHQMATTAGCLRPTFSLTGQQLMPFT
jgi:hypothetical protein